MQRFNYEVAADVFEIHDAQNQRHSILSLVDVATKFHVAGRVAGGGVPSSKICADFINSSWIAWAGTPDYFIVDQGVHNRGKVAHLLTILGTTIRFTAARAPHQLGIGERHGGIIKQMLKRIIHERQLVGEEDISIACSESASVKNGLFNAAGFTPQQWVMGFQPEDRTSLENFDDNIGVHQGIADQDDPELGPFDRYQKQSLIRQFAKEAYIKADSCQKIRKSMLRKAIPLRGSFTVGSLVSFKKKERWYGPARVLAHEGRSSLWLTHNGVAILVAETACRPASNEEVIKKQALELRPSRRRKRMREIDAARDLPFQSDLPPAHRLRQDQVPYVDIQQDQDDSMSQPTSSEVPPGLTPAMNAPDFSISGASSSSMLQPPPGLHLPEAEPAEEAPPSGPGIPQLVADDDINVEEDFLRLTTGSTLVTGGQLEPGVTPAPSTSQPIASSEAPNTEEATALTQAMRRSLDQLDGHFSRRPPTSNSFLARRADAKRKFKKNPQKAGAGREFHYERETPEVQKALQGTRTKEWSNWEHYSDGHLITKTELHNMMEEDPTRWVDINKAEPEEEPQYKSRLVVRGDLEDPSRMRIDSPTGSLTMLSMVLCLAISRGTTLHSGDISAAFLQGSKLDRVLILSLPKGGIPQVDQSEEEKFFEVSSTIYGTRDAPRGWFKNLHNTLKASSRFPMNMPHTPSSRRTASWRDFW